MAKPGSSALVAALVRNVVAETAYHNNDQTICAFNDFDKYFDTIDIPDLVKKHEAQKAVPKRGGLKQGTGRRLEGG